MSSTAIPKVPRISLPDYVFVLCAQERRFNKVTPDKPSPMQEDLEKRQKDRKQLEKQQEEERKQRQKQQQELEKQQEEERKKRQKSQLQVEQDNQDKLDGQKKKEK
jgi:hypothetical protein